MWQSACALRAVVIYSESEQADLWGEKGDVGETSARSNRQLLHLPLVHSEIRRACEKALCEHSLWLMHHCYLSLLCISHPVSFSLHMRTLSCRT